MVHAPPSRPRQVKESTKGREKEEKLESPAIRWAFITLAPVSTAQQATLLRLRSTRDARRATDERKVKRSTLFKDYFRKHSRCDLRLCGTRTSTARPFLSLRLLFSLLALIFLNGMTSNQGEYTRKAFFHWERMSSAQSVYLNISRAFSFRLAFGEFAKLCSDLDFVNGMRN